MDKNFYMRPPPEKPTLSLHMMRQLNINNKTAQEVLNILNNLIDKGVDLNTAIVEGDDDYEDNDYVYISYHLQETEKEFAVRMKKYTKDLSEYNSWKKKNLLNIQEWQYNRDNYIEIENSKRIHQLETELKKLKDSKNV